MSKKLASTGTKVTQNSITYPCAFPSPTPAEYAAILTEGAAMIDQLYQSIEFYSPGNSFAGEVLVKELRNQLLSACQLMQGIVGATRKDGKEGLQLNMFFEERQAQAELHHINLVRADVRKILEETQNQIGARMVLEHRCKWKPKRNRTKQRVSTQ